MNFRLRQREGGFYKVKKYRVKVTLKAKKLIEILYDWFVIS